MLGHSVAQTLINQTAQGLEEMLILIFYEQNFALVNVDKHLQIMEIFEDATKIRLNNLASKLEKLFA